MSPLIRKEVRLVLPAWSLAMLLAVLPVWCFWPGTQLYIPQSPGALVFVPFGLGVLLLGITPFGGELSLGTFSVLMAQPVPRRRLWIAKTLVVGMALVLALIALGISNHLRVDSVLETMKSTVWQNAFRRPGQPDKLFLNLITETRQAAMRDTWLIGGLSTLAAFAGGLWTTLLFRQTSAAFWSTVLVPMALGLLTAKLLGGFSSSVIGIGLTMVLGLYAAVGVLWAWRLFVRVQDVPWTGGTISFPFRGDVARAPKQFGSEHKRKPLGALLRNELQSQYINLLIAGGLLVLHVAILIFRKISAGYLATHVTAGMILEAFPLLWLSVPLLVGSVSIAEERKLGTLENLLCLPTTRRFQFVLKLGATLVLGVLLGAVLPVTLERLASLVGVVANPSGLWVINASRSTGFLLLFGSLALSFLSFYASTLTGNTLQALGAGVLVSVLGFMSIALAVQPPDLGDIILWRGILVGLIGTPVMFSTVLMLAYGNYKRLRPDVRTWCRNALILVSALVSVAGTTTAVYHRTWEAWLPLEPTHHFFSWYYANREHHFPATPKLEVTLTRLALLLPDGRLWLRHRGLKIEQVQAEGRVVEIRQSKGLWRSGLLPGSNWRAVAISDTTCFALQADGSLWDISPHQHEATAKQVGADHDWKLISAGAEHFTGLKTDGSLWEWVSADLGKRVDHARPVMPSRVGTNDDWVAVGDSEDRKYNPALGISVAVKRDGSIWRWGRVYSRDTDGSAKWQLVARPEKWLQGPAQLPVSIDLYGNAIAIVYEDGTLWLGGYRYLFLGSEKEETATHQMVSWGEDSNWKEVKMYSWDNAVGIKKDGTLWQFHSLSPPWQKAKWLLSRTQPSQYSDWLAVCADRDAFLAFAGDGSVCLWGDPQNASFWFNEPDSRLLLLPSRIKARRLATIPW
jgi:hypothetical protein